MKIAVSVHFSRPFPTRLADDMSNIGPPVPQHDAFVFFDAAETAAKYELGAAPAAINLDLTSLFQHLKRQPNGQQPTASQLESLRH